jgi:hypothetical protein
MATATPETKSWLRHCLAALSFRYKFVVDLTEELIANFGTVVIQLFAAARTVEAP